MRLNKEIKYIIVKDKIGHYRHFKSDFLHHETIARDNGFNPCDIVEAGLFLGGYLYILESQSQRHLERRLNHYIGNRLNLYQDLRLQAFLRGRELESQLYYSKKAIKTLPEGD